MRRHLPPLLLLLALLGFVAVRALSRPGRAKDQERLRAAVRAEETDAAVSLEAYLDRYTEAEDRWFGAEMALRLGRFRSALQTVFGDPALRDDPATLRRFGDLGLRVAGWRDSRLDDPTTFAKDALTVFVEAGETWAVRRLRQRARTEPLEETAQFLFYASRFAGPEVLAVLAEGFRENVEPDPERKEELRVAAAFSVLGKAPYPRREADIDRLIEVLRTHRRTKGDVWTASALALGRSKAPRAIEALERHEAHLADAPNPRDQRDRAILRIALLASGGWGHDAALRRMLETQPVDAFLADWYAEAALWRFLQGDPNAMAALDWTFRDLGRHVRRVRARLGRRILIPPGPPRSGEPADRAPVPMMLEILSTSRESPLMPGIAASYGLRVGEADALDRLLELMDVIASALEEGRHRHGRVMPGWILCLRAMRIYG